MRSIRKSANQMAATLGFQRRHTTPWNRPTHLFLEVTNRCNLSCVMCGRTHDRRYKDDGFVGDISMQIVRKLEPFFAHSSFVTATGLGEPFLNPQFLSILEFIKARGAVVSLTTNGTVLEEHHVEALCDLGVDRVVCSVDSPRKELFQKIRVGADLDRVLSNIARLSEVRARRGTGKPYLILEFVAMAQNFPQLPEMADLAHDLGFDEVIVQNLFKAFDPGYNAFFQKNKLSSLDPEEALSCWQEFLARARRHDLCVYSPFSNGGLRDYLREGAGEIARPLKSAHGFLGFLDRPEPASHAEEKFEVAGWALGKEGIPEVEVRLETANSTHSQPVPISVMRPDVLAFLPADYPQESRCGFAITLDSSTLPAGVATLSLLVRRDADSPWHTLARHQIFIRQPADYKMYCSQPWSTLYVTWDGRIRTCCFNEFSLGSLEDRDAEQIWWGEDYRALRSRVARGDVLSDCMDCLAGRSNPHYIRNWKSWLKLPR